MVTFRTAAKALILIVLSASAVCSLESIPTSSLPDQHGLRPEIVYPFQNTTLPFSSARHARSLPPDLRPSRVRMQRELVIGYFGRCEDADLFSAALWWTVRRALEDAQNELGSRLPPCRIVPLIKGSPWSDGATALAELIFQENAVAVIGGMDGEATHLAETIVAKAHLPLLAPISTDKTTNLAGVPWIFSLAPGDHLIAPVVAQYIAENKPRNIAVLLGNDHDSQWFWREVNKWLLHLGCLPKSTIILPPLEKNIPEAVQATLAKYPDWIVLSAPPQPLIAIIREIRSYGFSGHLVCDARVTRLDVLNILGTEADGILCPHLLPENLDVTHPFVVDFKEKFGISPDYAVLTTYDAVRMLLLAVMYASSATLSGEINRAEIQRQLIQLSPYGGLSGLIEWDNLNANKRPVLIGTIYNREVVAVKKIRPAARASVTETTPPSPAK